MADRREGPSRSGEAERGVPKAWEFCNELIIGDGGVPTTGDEGAFPAITTLDDELLLLLRNDEAELLSKCSEPARSGFG